MRCPLSLLLSGLNKPVSSAEISVLFPSFPPCNLTFSFLIIVLWSCSQPSCILCLPGSPAPWGCFSKAARTFAHWSKALPCPSPRALNLPGNILPDGVPALLLSTMDEIMSLKSGSLTRGRPTPFACGCTPISGQK